MRVCLCRFAEAEESGNERDQCGRIAGVTQEYSQETGRRV